MIEFDDIIDSDFIVNVLVFLFLCAIVAGLVFIGDMDLASAILLLFPLIIVLMIVSAFLSAIAVPLFAVIVIPLAIVGYLLLGAAAIICGMCRGLYSAFFPGKETT